MRLGPRRTLAVVLAAIVVIAVAVRLALDPLATWRTREVLAGLEGMDARFEDVSVSLLDLSYEESGGCGSRSGAAPARACRSSPRARSGSGSSGGRSCAATSWAGSTSSRPG